MSRIRMMIAVGFAAAGMLAASGCAKPRWKLGMQTYTFRTYTLLESIDKVNELGLEHIEAYSGQKVGSDFGDIQFDPGSSAEARESVKQKLAETGVNLVAYYFHTLGEDEAESRKVFEFARDMGVRVIVCEPPPDCLERVDKLANEYRINVAIHDHARDPKNPDYLYWNPDEVVKALEGRSKRMGTCADTGHWTRSGLDAVESLKKYEGRLICMHLKAMNKAALDGHDVVWGTGVTDMKAVLAEMRRQGFAGLASIEYEENPQDNLAEVAGCIKFHNETVESLGK